VVFGVAAGSVGEQTGAHILLCYVAGGVGGWMALSGGALPLRLSLVLILQFLMGLLAL